MLAWCLLLWYVSIYAITFHSVVALGNFCSAEVIVWKSQDNKCKLHIARNRVCYLRFSFSNRQMKVCEKLCWPIGQKKKSHVCWNIGADTTSETTDGFGEAVDQEEWTCATRTVAAKVSSCCNKQIWKLKKKRMSSRLSMILCAKFVRTCFPLRDRSSVGNNLKECVGYFGTVLSEIH